MPNDISSDSTSKPTSIVETKPLVVIGGLGCALLLCLAVLVGGSSFLLLRRASDAGPKLATGEETIEESSQPAVNGPSTPVTQAPPAKQSTDGQPDTAGVNNSDADSTDAGQPVVKGSPQISPIIFAAELNAQGEPVGADFSFTAGITRIHAVFEYANLGPNHIWTQVWYHNGQEVSRTSQPWLEATTGVYDYLIEAGSAPLPPGQWALEFYIDDELLSAGSITIEVPEQAAETVQPASSPEPNKVYKLAYSKWDGGKHNLFIGDTNGSREQYILSRAAGPAWSRDGKYLFFYGEEGVDQQVIDGRVFPLPGATNGLIRINISPPPASVQQVQLLQGTGWNDGTARSASISPDGSMIAFDGDRGGGRRIYFLGTAANQQFRIEIIGEQASWSPDSQKIVYRSGRNNQTGLWISNRDDTGHTRITEGGGDAFPTWSTDGQTIAFSREVGGNVDIYTINSDGSNLQRLTDTPGHDTLPLYLPNGQLVFRSARTGSWGIWKMDGDGSNQVEIIANAPVGPDWAYSKMDALR